MSDARGSVALEDAERFTVVPDPVVVPDVIHDERRSLRDRPLADPVWAACAVVLLALDGAAVLALSGSAWLTISLLVVSAALGSYRHRHTLTLSEGNGRYVILTVAVVLPMIELGDLPWHVVLFTLAVLASLLVSRTVGFFLVKVIRRRVRRRVLIAGAGPVALAIDRALTEHPEYGLDPAGFVSDVTIPDADRPVFTFDDAFAAIRSLGAVGMIGAFGPEPPLELYRLIRDAELDRRRVWVVPRMFDLSPQRDHIWGIAIAIIHRPPLYNPAVRLTKRVIDLVVATVALVLLSPVLLGLALLVRFTSKGPVLYRQNRLGLRGREFTMLKFRTMRVDSDVADSGWTVRDDPRRTVVGRLLRRTSLDELPQLVNVVRGQMSLIGPRPERRLYAEHFAQDVPTYPDRTRALGGMSGLAQVHDLRGDTSIEERARFDNRYVDQYSLFLDVVIALQTVGALFRSKQSY